MIAHHAQFPNPDILEVKIRKPHSHSDQPRKILNIWLSNCLIV
jgi:hypothetical protein